MSAYVSQASDIPPNKRILVIALSGAPGAGKSSVAVHCAKRHDSPNIVPLAKKIYEVQDLVYQCLDINPNPGKNRGLLQEVGKLGRAQDENFYSKKTVEIISRQHRIGSNCLEVHSVQSDKYDIFYVPDLRFPNESAYLRKHFQLLHVRLTGSYTGEVSDDESDHGFDNPAEDEFDLVISHPSSLDSIQDKIQTLVDEVTRLRA